MKSFTYIDIVYLLWAKLPLEPFLRYIPKAYQKRANMPKTKPLGNHLKKA